MIFPFNPVLWTVFVCFFKYVTFFLFTYKDFTKNKESLYRSLNGLNNANNGTRLYDSIVDVMQIFRNRGDTSRPWILVVVTDGEDNRSSRSLHKCAQEISSQFSTKNSNNFLFLVGVGDGVNSAKLNEVLTFCL